MNSKRKMPLRSCSSNRGDSKKGTTNCFTSHYTEEFTESQAERIFNRDFSIIVGAVIVILLLAIGGVI